MSASSSSAVAYDLYNPHQFPWWCIILLLALWLTATSADQLLKTVLPVAYKQCLDVTKQRNVVTYAVALASTIVIFCLQMYGGMDLLFRQQDEIPPQQLNALMLSLLGIALVYSWELIYRLEIGFPLLAHHLITLLLIQLSAASSFETHSPYVLRMATLIGFHATTEQTTFLALLLYRLQDPTNCHRRQQAFWFYGSAIQALLVKTSIVVAALYFYAVEVRDNGFGRDTGEPKWHVFWVYSLVPLLLALFVAQIYACYILYQLGNKCWSSSKDVSGAKSATSSANSDSDGDSLVDEESRASSFYDVEDGLTA